MVKASVSAQTDINPDTRGRASPIVVRVFELKSLAAFNGSDFFSLWERDQATLGPEMLGRDEFLMRPGEQKKYERTLQVGATHLGIVAAFRDLERARWRGAVAVVPGDTTAVTIKLEARSVSVSTGK